MKKTKDEIMLSLKNFFGDNTSDDVLTILEDVSDSIVEDNGVDYEEKLKTVNEEWETKYNENDDMWRKKYASRFYDGVENNEENTEDEDLPKKEKFEDLFEEVK